MIAKNNIIRISLLSILCCGGIFITSCNGNAGQQTAETAHAAAETSGSAAHHPASPAPVPPPETASADPAQQIPEFTFYILKSGIRFTREDLAKKGNIIFILFDPGCGHCQEEAKNLGEHYNQLKDVNLYFVSMNDPGLMSTFLETHAKPLVDKENVTLLYDRNAEFINKIHLASQYPATYVYGTDGQLKKYWDGDKDIKEIIEFFHL